MGEGFTVEWRRVDKFKNFLFLACCVLTGGLLALSVFTHPQWRKRFITTACSPEEADHVAITVEGKKHYVKTQHFVDSKSGERAVVVDVQCVRYIASNRDRYDFVRVPDAPVNFARFFSLSYEEEQESASLAAEQRLLMLQYGGNVMRIPSSSFFHILMRQLLSPFFIFQYFAAIVWFIEEYWTYATLIVVITFASAILNAREAMFNLERLRQLAGVQTIIDVLHREDNAKTLTTSHGPDSRLLPGTKFLITADMVLPCDAVLLSGKVVVDESMLTGESVPVSKTPIDTQGLGGAPADTTADRTQSVLRTASVLRRAPLAEGAEDEIDIAGKRPGNVLFGGTRVRACYGERCVAVAYRTGFRSAKGQLVASLLQPKEGVMNFVADALFIIGLTTFAISFVYIAIAFRLKDLGASDIDAFFYYLDALTIAVPPGLTACLTIATSIAIDRLKRKEVYVSDTTRVNFAGMITAACFDKTGTLTENSLQLLGALCTKNVLDPAHPVHVRESEGNGEEVLHDYKVSNASDTNAHNPHPLNKTHSHNARAAVELNTSTPVEGVPFLCQTIMATCHGLALEGEDETSARGDPLEEELLRASQWRLKHTSSVAGQLVAFPPSAPRTNNANNANDGYLVLKHFEFTPEKLRAASLVREPTGRVLYLLKGSPEVIVSLCDPQSVPAQVSGALSNLAKEGLRVIAIACKVITETDTNALLSRPQEEIERSAEKIVFLGLLYLSSALKWDTKKTIYRLQRAQVHVNMITGDHIHTAISVGGSCGILKYKTTHAAPQASEKERDAEEGEEKSNGPNKRLLVIVDADPVTEEVVLLDALTEKPIDSLTLPELVFDAARTYVTDFGISDSVFDFALTEEVEEEDREDDEDANETSATHKHGGMLSLLSDTVSAEDNRLSVKDANNMSGSRRVVSSASFSASPGSQKSSKSGKKGKTVAASALSLAQVEIAVTGKGLQAVFRQFPNHTALSLVRYAKIFARTKPYDKKHIVESLMTFCPQHLLQMARADDRLDLLCDELVPKKSWLSSLSPANFNSSVSEKALLTQHGDSSSPPPPEEQLSTDDELLQTMNVLFCGDGANDMIALRAATVGVSLCDTETSVAAPVTSREQTPGAVVEVLKEGRCSLVTAYVLILFNINYAVIQLTLAFSLYIYGIKLGNYMYLLHDMFFALFLGLAVSYSGPTHSLSDVLPPKRFFVPYIMSRLTLCVISFVVLQIVGLGVLWLQEFYEPFTSPEPLSETYSYEASMVFNFSLAQLLIAAIVSTIGKPFRESWIKNRYFLALLAVLSAYLLFQMFGGHNVFLTDVMEVKPMPVYFGFIQLGLYALQFLVCLAIRAFCDNFFSLKHKRVFDVRRFLGGKNKQKESGGTSSSRAVITKSVSGVRLCEMEKGEK